MAGVVRVPTALRGPETEAAGAALGVSSIQGEGPHATLVTSRALYILLRPGDNQGQLAIC